jgi:hypothetical protein
MFSRLVPLLLGFALGCGGTAVVEETVAGPDIGPLCSTPDPVGALMECGRTDGAGLCSRERCDDEGTRWEASCDETGCACYRQGELRCACAFDDGADPCAAGHTCCPEPWP